MYYLYGNSTLKQIFVTFLFLAISISAHSQANEQGENIVLSAIDKEQTHAVAAEILTEVYGQIGYNVSFKYVSPNRSLKYANDGVTDGDVARIAGTESKFTNLIPVSIPIMWFYGGVFTKSVKKNIESWGDLDGLRVGTIRGIRYSDIGTEGMNRHFADDMTSLFNMLDRDQVDVVVSVVAAGEIEVLQNFPNKGIHLAGKPIFKAPLYHFLHKKNIKLIPLLETVLKEMEQEGTLGSLHLDSLNDVKNRFN